METLFHKHDVTTTTPSSAIIVASFKRMQHMLACGIMDIRTQLTAYMYPNSKLPKSPLDPTPKQAAVIAARHAQPSITTYFKSSVSSDASPVATTRPRLLHKAIRVITTYARGSRTPRIHIVPPYIPHVPTNPLSEYARTTPSQQTNAAALCTDDRVTESDPRRHPSTFQVHSKTMLAPGTLYRPPPHIHWGVHFPSDDTVKAVEDGGLDGD
jgi:hypothetical protein